MQETRRQRPIRSGCRLQVQRSGLGGGRAARIDHDEFAAAGSLLVEILHQRRHRLGRVAAREEHGLGPRNIGDRKGEAAIDAESLEPGGCSRRHAEPPIVVDVRGADRHPGELAEQVGLLVGQAAAPEHGDRVGAVLSLDRGQAARHEIERFVPTGGTEWVALPVADERRQQTVGRVEQGGCCPSLAAETSAIGGKIARRDGQASVVGGQQRHAALQGTIRAVGVGRPYLRSRLGQWAVMLVHRATDCPAAGPLQPWSVTNGPIIGWPTRLGRGAGSEARSLRALPCLLQRSRFLGEP